MTVWTSDLATTIPNVQAGIMVRAGHFLLLSQVGPAAKSCQGAVLLLRAPRPGSNAAASPANHSHWFVSTAPILARDVTIRDENCLSSAAPAKMRAAS
eukprot:scaffold2738_cov366-Prasinococcus_capsulatus_cf.AAC.2